MFIDNHNQDRKFNKKKNKIAFTTESLGLSSLIIHYIGYEECEPLHAWTGKRDHFLIHYIIKGKGIYEVSGKKYELTAGDCFLVRNGDNVFFEADKNDPWHYCWVGFSGSEVSYLLSNTEFTNSNFKVSLQDIYDEKIQSIFKDMFSSAGNSLSDIIKMTSYAYLIFSILIEHRNSKLKITDRNYSKFIQISEYINQNISNSSLSVSNICYNFSLSSSSLYRLFINEIGISPVKYITEQKMKRACEIFRAEDTSISETAYRLGYFDPLYFSKHFKSYFKISPTEFIQLYRGNDKEIEYFQPFIP